MTDHEELYSRAKELKRFDDTKTGVKGLVDSGLNTIPPIFVHPPETLSDLKPDPKARPVSIPVINLAGFGSPPRRAEVVDKVTRAAREHGFFQIVNHGIPAAKLDRTIAAVKAFHEGPAEVKARLYRRDAGAGVTYMSNVDLYQSKAASWRDTLTVRLGPDPPVTGELPEVCREALVEWDGEVIRLGAVVMELLEEGLGLRAGRYRELTCLEGRIMVGHYYPRCPQPDLTVGLASHADPGVLTVLLQDHMGGLQVKTGGQWVDVKPVPGAIVINVGDLLQIMTNDQYKSVEHRVVANQSEEPRVSIGVFLNPGKREETYGPLPELISSNKPAAYQQFTFSEFMRRFFTKELDGKSLKNFFRI
ncbi:1-aminocyclopropane-1-carboxylate oxidase homolog 4 [Morus notabilis]|uniref:1-aminocyclopropane-1-carboxylate oxidase homolog 4 n=1 Tax=Morus notabilis TaxID=981085 RepID=UPI000CED0865|nr:1-aminocyclopropane-1-carboxylate oxidase homolog 4 [Morus notabilis]